MTTACAIAAVVVIVVAGAYIIARLLGQRDELAVENVDLLFDLAGVKAANRQLVGDYDAVVKRLAEVLDEHALCPAPVSTGLRVVPPQRDGSEYEWPRIARVLEIEGGA